jgi:hypothetical protein
MKMPSEESATSSILKTTFWVCFGLLMLMFATTTPKQVWAVVSPMLPYMKMGGGFVLSLVGVALVFGIVGFAVSAGWRLGKRLEKEEG